MRSWIIALSLVLCDGGWAMENETQGAPFPEDVSSVRFSLARQSSSKGSFASYKSLDSDVSPIPCGNHDDTLQSKAAIDPKKSHLSLVSNNGELYFRGERLKTLDPLTEPLKDCSSFRVGHYIFACQGHREVTPGPTKNMFDAMHYGALVEILKGFCVRDLVKNPKDSICSAWALVDESAHFRPLDFKWEDGDLFDKKTINARIDWLGWPIVVTEDKLFESGIVHISEPLYAIRFDFRSVVCGLTDDIEAFQEGQDLSIVHPEGTESGLCEVYGGGECLIPVSLFNEMESMTRARQNGDHSKVDFERHLAQMIWVRQPEPKIKTSLTRGSTKISAEKVRAGAMKKQSHLGGMCDGENLKKPNEALGCTDSEIGMGAGLIDSQTIGRVIDVLHEPTLSSANVPSSNATAIAKKTTEESQPTNGSVDPTDDDTFVIL
jgi:hypothetical protein